MAYVAKQGVNGCHLLNYKVPSSTTGMLDMNFRKALIDIRGSPPKFLSATGYEWVKVQRDNPVPANALKTILRVGWYYDRPIYIGRIGGQIPSGIIVIEGLVDFFSLIRARAKRPGNFLF